MQGFSRNVSVLERAASRERAAVGVSERCAPHPFVFVGPADIISLVPKARGEIIAAFASYFEKIDYGHCYIGVVASNIGQRLFTDHRVSENDGAWIFSTASSNREATEVENHFRALGMDGAPSCADDSALIVYAYAKTRRTNP